MVKPSKDWGNGDQAEVRTSGCVLDFGRNMVLADLRQTGNRFWWLSMFSSTLSTAAGTLYVPSKSLDVKPSGPGAEPIGGGDSLMSAVVIGLKGRR